jgi:hypothetical protein
MFPAYEMKMWEHQLNTDPTYRSMGIHGYCFRDSSHKVEFKVDFDKKPIKEAKPKKGDDKNGATTIYFFPYKDKNGRVPENTYYVVADPYGLNTEGGESLGAAYVLCDINGEVNHPDDCIVASYVGRPADQDEWNEQLFLLAEYYNARITPENDRGNIIDYARYNNLLHQLEPEFGILLKEGKERNKLGRGYGVSMSDIEVKKQGVIYYRDWMMRKRGKDKDGKQIYNYNLIFDIGLIRENREYNLKGNFDRVSAMLIMGFVRRHRVDMKMNQTPSGLINELKNINFNS